MEDICRLCLYVSHESLEEVADHLDKILSCFSIKIDHNQLLPKQICTLCINKINEACEFQKKIIVNENLLQEHLRQENGINRLCLKIRSKFSIKQESDELLENKENASTNIDKINFGTSNDEQKLELEDVAEINTSDDELLSKIKQEKVKSEIKKEDTTKWMTGTHKCLTCYQILDTQTNLLKHYKTVHFSSKDSDKMSAVGYTIKMSDNSAVYICNECSKEYRSKKYINRHLIGHSDRRPYLCKLCGRTYKTASEIIRHGRVHSEAKLFCSYQCGYSTAYLGALRAHEKRHDKSDYKYKCETCHKGFDVRTWYEQHQNIHNGLKPFVCDICGLAFHMDRYLTSHRSTAHPQSSNLKRYLCVHCSLPCDSKKALREHYEVHGIRSSFLCDLCGKTLSSAEQLKLHKRMHLGDKPYTCSTCNKSFAKKFNLVVHARAHAGERAHACARCGRAYSQRSALVRHYTRHHPGIEPEDCGKCQKSFPSMNKHLLKMHKKNCKGEKSTSLKD